MTIRYEQSPSPTEPGPAPMPRRPRRVGRVFAVTGVVAVAFLAGLGVGRSQEPTVLAQPVAPTIITRDVPGPTVTVPGPTVTVQAPAPAPVTVTAAPAAPAVEAPAAGTTFTAGTYEVGTEIKPGNYKTSGSSYCYWARLKSNDGEFGSIIANGNEDGPSSMSVKASDKYIEFSGTCSWTKK